MQADTSPVGRRLLPLRQQARIVGMLALAAACVLALGWGCSHPEASSTAAGNGGSTAATELRLTNAQLATLGIDQVKTAHFHSEQIADGKIALNADTATQVFSPYSGQVMRVIAALGAQVKAGAPLLAVAASEIVQAQSDLLDAGSQLKLARITEERRHAAFESKGGSLQDWQQAQADLVAAQTAFESARNRLRILGKTDEEITAMQSAVRPDAIAYVLAPIGGVVTDREVGPGQYLQAGSSTPVYTIGDLSTVWLEADVREVDAPRIEPGQAVDVRVLAFPDRVFTATLTTVGATVDPVTRRVPVRATIPNPDRKLKPEMFASFSIVTSKDSIAPGVPEEAIVREGDDARVWVLRADNVLSLREIRTGRNNNGLVEVTSGLNAGERVVTRGSLFIDRAARPG
jgi:cobalt-zinc-cadmium efflux system membrane fusion protein